MDNQSSPQKPSNPVGTAIEITIRVAVLVLVVGWCFLIMSPFVSLIVWAIVIAVASYPLFFTLREKLGGRGKLAAATVSVSFSLLILLPAIFLGESLVEGIQHLRTIYQTGELTIPPPGDEVNSWPAIAKPVADLWREASENLSEAMTKFAPQIKVAGGWLLKLIGGASLGALQLVGSIIIAGVLLGYAKEGGDILLKIFVRLAGQKGADFADISKITIRNVVKGILGVAIAQTFLAGIGFVVAGVPLAGLWTLFCLILAIMQVGVAPIVLPVAIYMYSTSDVLTASLFLAWSILVTLSDNILKPILLGKGAPAPMLVVFLGSIGGFITGGFVGLFIGPVVLTLGYKLFLIWVESDTSQKFLE